MFILIYRIKVNNTFCMFHELECIQNLCQNSRILLKQYRNEITYKKYSFVCYLKNLCYFTSICLPEYSFKYCKLY